MKIHSTRKLLKVLLLTTTLSLGFAALVRHELKTHQDRKQIDQPTRARVSQAYGKLPLSFEANRGQTDKRVNFLSRGSGYTLFLTPTEAVLRLARPEPKAKSEWPAPKGAGKQLQRTGTVLRMQLVGANSQPQGKGMGELPGKVNYLIGNDPMQWHTDVPTYARVEYQDVYPGVDLLYYGNPRELEYDFIVAPGAKPRAIELAFQGADQLRIAEAGNLVTLVDGVEMIQPAPVSYQEIDGVRHAITSRYVLRDDHRVGFEVGAYDAGRTLVIDPMLVYSTFLGGSSNDAAFAIAVDSQGFAYVTGGTMSSGFPTQSFSPMDRAFDPTFDGGTQTSPSIGGTDVFVSKLNPQGSALVFSTFLGGSEEEQGLDIALDGDLSVYVTGYTWSANFPKFPTNPPDRAFDTSHHQLADGFVTKLNARGSALVYSTFLGGMSMDVATAIAVNSQGIAYVAGYTSSTDFPTFPTASIPNAFNTIHNGLSDGFVTKLNAKGSALVYSTFLGGSGDDWINDIAVQGDLAYVTGSTNSTTFPTFPTNTADRAFNTTLNGRSDGFVTKLNAMGSALVYSTFLGGTDNDQGNSIAVDSQGLVYVAGSTWSANFPVFPTNPPNVAFDPSHNGSSDGFVTKLNARGSALVYSTFLGGSGYDTVNDIALVSSSSSEVLAHVTGSTSSANFPKRNEIPCQHCGLSDVFVTKLNAQGSALAFSTVLGGTGDDAGMGIGLDGIGNAFVAGYSASSNFPTTPGSKDTTHNGGYDAVVFEVTTGP